MGQRLVVSEFPNDNPELHDGLVWACPTPCAPALPTLRLRASAPVRVLRPEWESKSDPGASQAPLEPPISEPEREPAAEAVSAPVPDPAAVSELEPGDEPEALEPSPDAPSPTGFDAFVRVLSDILAARGATRAAANIGALLGMERLAPDAFDAETKKALVSRGILDEKSGRPTPEFSMLSRAWRDVSTPPGAISRRAGARRSTSSARSSSERCSACRAGVRTSSGARYGSVVWRRSGCSPRRSSRVSTARS